MKKTVFSLTLFSSSLQIGINGSGKGKVHMMSHRQPTWQELNLVSIIYRQLEASLIFLGWDAGSLQGHPSILLGFLNAR